MGNVKVELGLANQMEMRLEAPVLLKGFGLKTFPSSGTPEVFFVPKAALEGGLKAEFSEMLQGTYSIVTSADLPLDRALMSEVIGAFGEIPEVKEIYHTSGEETVRFWVFTDNQQYDDALMESLLSKEADFMHTYPELTLIFRYVPLVLCSNPKKVTGKNAQRIFRR